MSAALRVLLRENEQLSDISSTDKRNMTKNIREAELSKYLPKCLLY